MLYGRNYIFSIHLITQWEMTNAIGSSGACEVIESEACGLDSIASPGKTSSSESRRSCFGFCRRWTILSDAVWFGPVDCV